MGVIIITHWPVFATNNHPVWLSTGSGRRFLARDPCGIAPALIQGAVIPPRLVPVELLSVANGVRRGLEGSKERSYARRVQASAVRDFVRQYLQR